MRLLDGAEAIRGDLPSSATRLIDVPLEAGDELDSGISRLSSLQLVRQRLSQEIAAAGGPVLTIGGDCGVEWAPISAFAGSDVTLVWFDAHPDLNSPATSPSAAFHGMVLRTILDEGFDPGRVVLAGARAFDDAEAAYVESAGIVHIPCDRLTEPAELVKAIEASGGERVYVHIDVDVLDPAFCAALGYPEPFGLDPAALVSMIGAIRERWPIAGAGLTEFAPESVERAADDLPTILRILSALTRASG
ncbi:arginase family protein [Lysobacter korlensis]|uniref:Arginase family protein n=1 Tax=Lysobacter korlensis TaxID=553636 RepID=A0ABV6S2V4_9GAMM